MWKWQPDLLKECPGTSPFTLPKSQNTTWFCRATWRRVPSLCMKIPLVAISKLGWLRLQPWKSHGATTEITKLWFAICLGSIIPLLQCNKGKTLIIRATRQETPLSFPGLSKSYWMHWRSMRIEYGWLGRWELRPISILICWPGSIFEHEYFMTCWQ